LSFEVERGEIVVLLGPNGAGKTTTLRCIAGVLLPDKGSILVNGTSILHDPVTAKKQLGYLPEFPQPMPYLTVWEHLELIARIHAMPDNWRQQADELVQRLNLTEWRDSLGKTLPKGVREKTILACAMLPEPPLLLLDEPIVAIDPIGQQVVKGMLREWRERGHGILISTHILAFAEELADRIIMIDRGTKIAGGRQPTCGRKFTPAQALHWNNCSPSYWSNDKRGKKASPRGDNHDSANLGARKAIDETTAAMANSFALCGFRFHRIGSSNMGLDQRKCPLETFAEPTGLLACARFFFLKPTLVRRSTKLYSPLARMEIDSANTCTRDDGIPLGICICELVLLLFTPHIADDCERINSVEGSSGCSGYHDVGCCHRSERLLGSSVGIVRNDWMAHEIGTCGQVVENVGEGFGNKCNCFIRAFRCLS
jgi:ABC-2 type transport system ATP-binding protein